MNYVIKLWSIKIIEHTGAFLIFYSGIKNIHCIKLSQNFDLGTFEQILYNPQQNNDRLKQRHSWMVVWPFLKIKRQQNFSYLYFGRPATMYTYFRQSLIVISRLLSGLIKVVIIYHNFLRIFWRQNLLSINLWTVSRFNLPVFWRITGFFKIQIL